MAATTKLIVYNEVLREHGTHPLADLVTANTRLQELNGAFNHAVEYLLGRVDWNFARRRATLTGVADTSFSPYTHRYARPTDYLRKLWIKTAATDEFQIEHAEIAAVFYGYEPAALIEYVSDHADNYDPANWPPHFTRCVVLYLALLTGPKLARLGPDDAGAAYQKLDMALAEAERAEAVYAPSERVASERLPVMRRAMEIMGQVYSGSMPIHAQADQLRYQMNLAWDDAVRFVLEQAPWNFALRRATLAGTADATTFPPYTIRLARPAGFLKRVWIRTDPNDAHEADYGEASGYFWGYDDGAKIMEYVAADDDSLAVANWPQSFVELIATYLAAQIVPPTTQTTTDKEGKSHRQESPRDALLQQFAVMMAAAETAEAGQHQSKSIPANRLPIMRRAFEIMGQQLAGFTAVSDANSRLRWQMNLAWDDAVSYILEAAAWNFATKRALLTTGAAAGDLMPGDEVGGIIEGYSVEGGPGNGESPFDQYAFAGYKFAWYLPDDFRHKIWLKLRAEHDTEIDYQIIRDAIFTNHDPCVLEYIAEDAWTTDPAHWPFTFRETMAARLAFMVVPDLVIEQSGKGTRVKADGLRDKLDAYFNRALGDAKIKDAIQQAVKTIPHGRFARARMGSGTSSHRRWN